MNNLNYGRAPNVGYGFNNFRSNQYINGTSEFLYSNSLVAKLAFLLLIVIIFILALRLGITLLSLLFGPKSSPTLIDGIIDSKQMMIIPQDPKSKTAIPVARSVNKDSGIQFTWSTWIFIDDITYGQGKYRHIFHKGNDNINILSNDAKNGMNFPNNAPGLYIAPNSNDLVVVINTFNKISEEITIEGVPVKKWINVIIRCNGNTVDVFINGTLTRRYVLSGVPKQNYGDVYVSMNGGFAGYTSSLRYFDSAIGVNQIQKIMKAGPSMKAIMTSTTDMATKPTPYLSLRWYFGNN
jgi:hypothetical protein